MLIGLTFGGEMMHGFSVSQVSISAPVRVFAAAEEWLFLERFEELFIDLCQSTKRGAVAAAPLSLPPFATLLFLSSWANHSCSSIALVQLHLILSFTLRFINQLSSCLSFMACFDVNY